MARSDRPMSTTSAGSSALVYAMPRPPPRFELGQLDAELVAHLCEQPDHPVRGDLEAAGVEDLRADVRVQPDQLEPGGRLHPAYRLERVAADQREAELLVLVRGRDELVGVRLDADGAADQHALGRAALDAQAAEPVDLGDRVDDDPADAGVEGGGQLGDRLVVAVQQQPVAREAGPHRDRELAAGAHVEAEPLLLDPAGDRGAQERLGRVEDHRAAERLAVVAAAAAQVGLVEQEDRAAVLGDQVADVVPAQGEPAGVGAGQAERPDGRVECAEVGRRAGVQALVGELAGPGPGRVGAHRRTATSARAR